jgi:hypothetical protein
LERFTEANRFFEQRILPFYFDSLLADFTAFTLRVGLVVVTVSTFAGSIASVAFAGSTFETAVTVVPSAEADAEALSLQHAFVEAWSLQQAFAGVVEAAFSACP